MPDQHHHIETGTEHDHVAEHAHGNRNSAILIAGLAALLAISETLGKAAQTDAVTLTIRESDSWNYYQAKTIRQTIIDSDNELISLFEAGPARDALKEKWTRDSEHIRSDQNGQTGREELRRLAESYQHEAHRKLEAYHRFELGSAAFQIAIVLASAAIVTAAPALTYIAIIGGVIGLAMNGWGALTLWG
jgi:hypothetical protein